MQARAIGIDLGTTNSCAAVMENGAPVIIPTPEGDRTTPSVVAFTKDGERLTGRVAKRQAAANPSRTFASVKRHMGSDWRAKVDGEGYNAQEISAMVLRKLKSDAESYLGEKVTDAVITVPAYFNDTQRQATKDAGRIAGLNVLRIINEPTSAALAYGLNNGAAQKVMVYDLGGGTFDVSVIEIGDGVVQVLATAGNNHLGGDDFDARIAKHLFDEFRAGTTIDLTRDPAAAQRVHEAAEQAKKELSSAEVATISLPFIAMGKDGPVHMETTLTRAKMVSLIRDLIDMTAGPVSQALSDAGLSARDLSKVLLVGGSTRIPAVQQKVRELTGVAPSKSVNPDECVAMGAAMQAAILTNQMVSLGGEAAKGTGSSILLLDVTSMSLSIETVGGVATRLVERNSQLPIHYSKIFTTTAPFQSAVEINVLQGERPMASDNKSIGRFKLTGIKRAMPGVPQIEVTFDIDANGILQVSAKDLGTGKAQSITISAESRMSEAEIEQAIRDAETYKAQDGIRRDAVEAVNAARKLLTEVAQAQSGPAYKALDRAAKKQIKADYNALNKLTGKFSPAKVTESDLRAIQDATAALESTSACIRG